MRLVADENCDFSLVTDLRAAGYDVVAITEQMAGADDQRVIDFARSERRLLVTEDKDFGQLVFAAAKQHSGVILIRYPASARSALTAAVLKLLSDNGESLYSRFATPGFRKIQTVSGQSADDNPVVSIAACLPLPWSHYARLLTVRNLNGREFYEAEALRGGWTIRQLNRQIESQFYERTVLSKDKSNMLRRGSAHLPADVVTPEDEIKDPYFLEFLALKDEYSETDLESALIMKLETFLLELGGDFAFVGRQRRLRVGDAWYRVDLLFFHRRLRCLIIVDLKLGKFTHADAGQMHLYVNYAREHWAFPGENPPVGLILCAEKDGAVAKYALEGLPNKVLAAEYRTTLPEERLLVEEIRRTRKQIEVRRELTASQPKGRKPGAGRLKR